MQSKSFVIGVAGLSSSGKSTLSGNLASLAEKNSVAILDMDGYHFRSRADRKKINEYPDQIDANDFHELISHIKALRSGRAIFAPTYSHVDGLLGKPVRVTPKPIVIVEGLHAGLLNNISTEKIIDFSIFVYPSEELRKEWKIRRDIVERNYPRREAIRQLAERQSLEKNYLLPQISIVDAVIRITKETNSVLLSDGFVNRFPDPILHKLITLRKRKLSGQSFFELDTDISKGAFSPYNSKLVLTSGENFQILQFGKKD